MTVSFSAGSAKWKRLGRHRLAGKSLAPAPDSPRRWRGKMRGAAQRVGVAIAIEEIAPRRGGLRLIDIEFRRQFGVARLQRRMHQIAADHGAILATAEGERDMSRRMARRRQGGHG